MISDHVTSLEWSKRLKELGVKQTSIFYWWQRIDDERIYFVEHYRENPAISNKVCSAFLASELGELLPRTRKYKFDNGQEVEHELRYGKTVSGDYFVHTGIEQKFANTESDARAAMLCYLIENKIIEVPK